MDNKNYKDVFNPEILNSLSDKDFRALVEDIVVEIVKSTNGISVAVIADLIHRLYPELAKVIEVDKRSLVKGWVLGVHSTRGEIAMNNSWKFIHVNEYAVTE